MAFAKLSASRLTRAPSIPEREILTWVNSGLWAVSEQALFAVANFGFNIMLARRLPGREYGAYALAWSIFSYVVAVHSALLIEPMLVFGPGRFGTNVFGYMRAVMKMHAIGVAALGLGFLGVGIAALALGGTLVGQALIGIALCAPVVLSLWLVRRAAYVMLSVRQAAGAGVVYLILLAVMSAIGLWANVLALSSAFAIVALSAAGAAGPLMKELWTSQAAQPRQPASEVWSSHWSYGRWSVAAAVFNWIPGAVGILLLPIWGGLASAGAYRVLQIFLLPLMQTLGALSVVSTVTLSRAHGQPGFRDKATMVFVSFGLLGTASTALLLFAGRELVHIVYSGRYDASSGSICILAPSCLCYALDVALVSMLQSLGRSDLVFRSAVVTTAVAIATAAVLIPQWGIDGAAASWTVSTAASLACLVVLALGQERKRILASYRWMADRQPGPGDFGDHER